MEKIQISQRSKYQISQQCDDFKENKVLSNKSAFSNFENILRYQTSQRFEDISEKKLHTARILKI